MNVSFITTKSPTLTSGSEVRNYYLLKALIDSKKIDHVEVLFLKINRVNSKTKLSSRKLHFQEVQLPSRNSSESLANFVQLKIPYIEHLKRNPFSSQIEEVLEKSDVVVLSELDAYFAVSEILNNRKFKAKIILDCHNVDYLRFKSEIELSPLPKKILGQLLLPTVKNEEISAIKAVDQILCCSEHDQKYFSQFVPSNKITVIPNGVVIESSANKAVKPSHTILFMGLLSYIPNSDAMKFYFESIHEQVKYNVPDLKVTIIGKNPPDWLLEKAKADSSIKVLGFVDSLKEYFEEAAVCICPLRFGSGTRLKILEYMAASKPIVSTSIGAEGIEVKNNKNIFISDSPVDFSEKIVELLENSDLAKKIGENARELVSTRYNWELITENFIETVVKA